MASSLELRQVRYFIAVAQERGFGRAAERLRIAQSAVSTQIKALERLMGVTLFDRDARPVELTPAGGVFLDHALRLLDLAERAVFRTRLAATEQREGMSQSTS